MIDWWGPVINESYASSEAGFITLLSSEESRTHPGSAGRPLAGADVRIMDDAGDVLPPFEPGLIYCRQAAYPDFTYINRDDDRQAIDRDGLVAVGDVGYFDRDGYLYICDRKSDMVISGGVNIYPAEIEAVLITMPEVADCAVFGIPDAEFGEALAAHVQPHNGAAIEREAVRAFLQGAHRRLQGAARGRVLRCAAARGVGQDLQAAPARSVLGRGGAEDLTGTHITALRFMKDYGFQAKLVATGNVPATFTSVMSGQVDIGFSTPPFGLDALAEGRAGWSRSPTTCRACAIRPCA